MFYLPFLQLVQIFVVPCAAEPNCHWSSAEILGKHLNPTNTTKRDCKYVAKCKHNGYVDMIHFHTSYQKKRLVYITGSGTLTRCSFHMLNCARYYMQCYIIPSYNFVIIDSIDCDIYFAKATLTETELPGTLNFERQQVSLRYCFGYYVSYSGLFLNLKNYQFQRSKLVNF